MACTARRLLLGTAFGAVVPLLSGQAYAQTAPAAEAATAADVPAQQAAPPEDIIVTGSRIQSTGFTAPTPTSVVTAAQIASVAPTRIDDALRLVPAFSTTGSGVARAVSSSTVTADLRGIGPQRTLVLLNGRRHVATAPDGTIDLSVIPAILVSRTEVVTGGASASWGSDAVSGVINLILKTDLQGLEGSLQSGISRYGDAGNQLAALAGGTSFAGGEATFSSAANIPGARASARRRTAPGAG
jgi:iron complex outermembrane receptor protein